MKTIQLTRGKEAQVDDGDYDWLIKWKWYAKKVVGKNRIYWYAARVEGHRGPTVFMHREIGKRMDPTKPWCDHWDGNGLKNVRVNLRPCTPTENKGNSRKTSGLHSRFKGVSFHKGQAKWVAQIAISGKPKWLGTFPTQASAARAYNAAAMEQFGQFARVNTV